MAKSTKRAAAGALLGASLDELAVALRTSSSSVRVAAPFLSLAVAQLIVRATRLGRSSQRRLLAALNPSAVEGGYLDPMAVEAFADSEFEVRSLPNLHAKAVLIDASWGVIGSGNLTEAGSNGGNAELGIMLDPEQTAEAERAFFDRWWKAAEPIEPSDLRRLRKKRPPAPERRRTRGHGGFYKTPPGSELAAYQADPRQSPYWLKIVYARPGRERASTWRGTTWVNDSHSERDGIVQQRPRYASW
jgi:hypothetical protein